MKLLGKTLFYKLPKNIADCFRGYNLLWQLLAILLTYFFVQSGFDWSYFQATRGSWIALLLFPAVILGGLLPIIVPLSMLAIGRLRKSARTVNAAWGVGQAAVVGLLTSSFYKAFTGRMQPPHIFSTLNVLREALIKTPLPASINTIVDTSREFRFGFMRGGIFWGWPSSHTTVAFATAIALVMLYPKNRWIRYLAPLYALYVGLGVSVSIHWFSEFIAGMIFGTVVGIIVGKSFYHRHSGPTAETDS